MHLCTYSGKTIEFVELADRVLHVRPRSTLELSDKEIELVRDQYPQVFSKIFVHGRPTKKEVEKSEPVKPVVDKVEKPDPDPGVEVFPENPTVKLKKPGRPKKTDQ